MTKKRGMAFGLIAVAIIIAIAITTTLSNGMTLNKAKEIASQYVPKTAEFQTSEEEDTKFEVIFYDSTNKESFEVEVSKKSEKVKKVETQLDNDLGSKNVKLTQAQAEKIVKERFEGIKSISSSLNIDDGLYEYEIVFKSNDFYGSADINPETGAILETTLKFGTATTIPNDSNGDKVLTYEDAKAAAIKHAGGGTIKDIDLDKENGKYVYEIELIKDNKEYDYYVDATSGAVTLGDEHENHINTDATTSPTVDTDDDENQGSSSSDVISIAKAKNIVLAKIPGASIYSMKLEKDDGRLVYEGEAKLGDYEYDFEINASSGVIISWEKDRIDDDKYDDHDDDDEDDYDDEDDDEEDDD